MGGLVFFNHFTGFYDAMVVGVHAFILDSLVLSLLYHYQYPLFTLFQVLPWILLLFSLFLSAQSPQQRQFTSYMSTMAGMDQGLRSV